MKLLSLETANTVIVSLIVAFCVVKVIEHKDDEDKTHLAVYSSILAVASAIIAYVFYNLYTFEQGKDIIVDKIMEDLKSSMETVAPLSEDKFENLTRLFPTGVRKIAEDKFASLAKNVPTGVRKIAEDKIASLAKKALA